MVRLWVLRGWVVLVVALLLGPALLPGYVLSYDMVWVPDLVMRSDFLGWGTGIPRAVPSDAVISVLDEVIPSMLLQKIVLAAPLIAGGLGIRRWVDDERVTLGGAAAATFYLWNPYVVERLAIGHWPMLVCLGVLPWLALAVREGAKSGRFNPWVLLLLPLASLNASAGLAAGVVVAIFGFRRARLGVSAAFLGAVMVANLPWLFAGLVKVAAIHDLDTSSTVFAAAGEGSLPGPLTALTLGGLWNADLIPGSRLTALAWVSVVVVLLSLTVSRRTLFRRDIRPWCFCGAVGWGVALLSWAAPGVIDTLGTLLPGAGVLRDGSRLLVLLVPLVAIAMGVAVDRFTAVAGEVGPIVGVALVLLPVAILPDGIWGIGGDLRAVDYPPSYDAMVQTVSSMESAGDVLVLPFTAYRAPAWNHDRKVFDPVGRLQPRNYLASDSLSVSGRELPPEDSRGGRALAAIRLADPKARAVALGEIGIGLVVTEKTVAADDGQDRFTAPVAGENGRSVPGFNITRLASVQTAPAKGMTRNVMSIAWIGYLGTIVSGLVFGMRRTLRRE